MAHSRYQVGSVLPILTNFYHELTAPGLKVNEICAWLAQNVYGVVRTANVRAHSARGRVKGVLWMRLSGCWVMYHFLPR